MSCRAYWHWGVFGAGEWQFIWFTMKEDPVAAWRLIALPPTYTLKRKERWYPRVYTAQMDSFSGMFTVLSSISFLQISVYTVYQPGLVIYSNLMSVGPENPLLARFYFEYTDYLSGRVKSLLEQCIQVHNPHSSYFCHNPTHCITTICGKPEQTKWGNSWIKAFPTRLTVSRFSSSLNCASPIGKAQGCCWKMIKLVLGEI